MYKKLLDMLKRLKPDLNLDLAASDFKFVALEP